MRVDSVVWVSSAPVTSANCDNIKVIELARGERMRIWGKKVSHYLLFSSRYVTLDLVFIDQVDYFYLFTCALSLSTIDNEDHMYNLFKRTSSGAMNIIC